MWSYLVKEARWLRPPVVFLSCGLLLGFWSFIATHTISSNLSVDRQFALPFGWDFSSFWFAGKLALSGQVSTVYNLEAFQAYQRSFDLSIDQLAFFYPPTWLGFVAPFSLLPFWAAVSAFVALSIPAAMLSCRALDFRTLDPIVFLASPLVFYTFSYGQNGCLSLALLGGAFSLLTSGRNVAAGVLFGLMTYKPQLGILVPIVLLAGQYWTAFFTAILTTLVLVLLTGLAWGFEVWELFVHQLFYAASGFIMGAVNLESLASIAASLQLAGFSERFGSTAQYICLAASVGLVIWFSLRSRDRELVFAFAICLTTLATPVILQYDLVILAWPFAVLTRRALHGGFLPYERLLLATTYLIPLLSRITAFSYQLQLTPFASLLLSALILMRAFPLASAQTGMKAKAGSI